MPSGRANGALIEALTISGAVSQTISGPADRYAICTSITVTSNGQSQTSFTLDVPATGSPISLKGLILGYTGPGPYAAAIKSITGDTLVEVTSGPIGPDQIVWKATAGTFTVASAQPLAIASGTVDADLSSPTKSQLHISGSWSCPFLGT